MQTAISTCQLTVAYGDNTALWNVSTEIPQGKISAIIGPNGAGKSTLLKAILGMVPTLSGSVVLHQSPSQAVNQASDIGYVPQRSSVDWDFPITVLDLVLMGTYGRLRWFQRPGEREKAAAMECLKQVEMEDFCHRQIGQLSGGQQQRVFLARAFVQQASVYLLDEPFAGVDAKTEQMIIEILQQLRESGNTVTMVHHDLTTVQSYFDHVILLNKQLVASGPTGDTFTQENLQETYGIESDLLRQSSKQDEPPEPQE